MLADRVLPHSPEAERAIVGGILGWPDRYHDVSPIVSADDFHTPLHAVVFSAFTSLAARGQPIDTVTVFEEMDRRTPSHELMALQDAAPTAAYIETHAKTVRDLALLRAFIREGETKLAEAYARPRDVGGFLDAAAQAFGAIGDRVRDEAPKRLNDCIDRAFKRIETAQERGARITGIETGFRELDDMTAGLHPGQLIVIAARPAMGKTSYATNMAVEIARKVGSSLLISLEMPEEEVTNRILCGEARVDQSRLRTMMLTADDMTALTTGAARIYNAPMYIDDSGTATIRTIRRKARSLRKDLKLVLVDYLQLMSGLDGDENREREIASISRGLKQLAKELKIPVIALSQLNRAPETRPGKNRRPQLSDLRESGAIEQDADVVMFIYRDEVYNRDTEDKGVAEIIVAKQRNGPTDTVRLRFVRELTKFETLDDGDEFAARQFRDAPPPDANWQEPE